MWTKGAKLISQIPKARSLISVISTSCGRIALGAKRPIQKYPWAAIFYGDKGTLKASVISYDFTPSGGGQNIHRDVTYELEQYSRRQNRKGSGKTRSACHPRTHEGFSRRHFQPQQTRCRYRTRLYFDDHLYPGQSLDAAWPDSGLGSGERAGDWRCGSKSLTATAIPRSLGAS